MKSSKTLLDEKKNICKIMNLRPDDSKDQIIIDFYMSLFRFGMKIKLSNEKISTMISILYFLFNYSIMNKKLSKEKSFNLFLDIMEFHSLNRPPYCSEIFSVDDKQNIIEFIKNSFYRNFMIFENIFKYNINICLQTKIYNPFQNNVSQVMLPLNTHLKTDSINFTYIHKYYIEKHAEKEKQQVEQKVKKSEVELYEEMQMDKLKSFVKTFYKTKENVEGGVTMMEAIRNQIMKETQLIETTGVLDSKIPEILKDTTDKITIKNREIFKLLPNLPIKK